MEGGWSVFKSSSIKSSHMTNLKESIIILIHQLSDFGNSGHKFFKNFEDAKWQLIQAAAKNTQCPAFLTQGTTYGKRTKSFAEPTELWPTDWAIDQSHLQAKCQPPTTSNTSTLQVRTTTQTGGTALTQDATTQRAWSLQTKQPDPTTITVTSDAATINLDTGQTNSTGGRSQL